MKQTALLVIDYTCDFVSDTGALTCGQPAQALDKGLTSCMRRVFEKGGAIIAPCDTHVPWDTKNTEARLFPPHNIKGTPGREIFGLTGQCLKSLKEEDEGRAIELDKTVYDAFHATPLALFLRNRGIKRVALCGVCTDICVLHTAVGAYNLGFETAVLSDLVASFDEGAHTWALTHMKNVLGAAVLPWERLVVS